MTIKALNLRWINNEFDDSQDQCAHGEMTLTVDGIDFVTDQDGELTLSGAAFYLLRTLESSHTQSNSATDGNNLLPCCAFNAWPIGENESLVLLGCDGGIDLHVEHLPDDLVRIARGDISATVFAPAWRIAVVQFAKQIEKFYAASSPKAEVVDDFERKGWALFWTEWHTLLSKYVNAV